MVHDTAIRERETMKAETTKSRITLIGIIAVAAALCIALAGCGSSASSSGSAVSGSSSAASSSSSSESGSSSSSAASASSTSSASSASASYTAGNGTLDCEYITLEVTGQEVWHHSDGTEGTELLLHIVNKTDHEIHLDPTGSWDVNGNVGYGLIMEDPAPNGEVDTWAFWTDENSSTVSEGGIQTASGMITVMDEDFKVLGRYDFSYTA